MGQLKLDIRKNTSSYESII